MTEEYSSDNDIFLICCIFYKISIFCGLLLLTNIGMAHVLFNKRNILINNSFFVKKHSMLYKICLYVISFTLKLFASHQFTKWSFHHLGIFKVLLTKFVPTEVIFDHDSFAKYWTSWRLHIGVALLYSVSNWLTICNWFKVDFLR